MLKSAVQAVQNFARRYILPQENATLLTLAVSVGLSTGIGVWLFRQGIDLFGQVNAESLDGRQVSSVGGLADYVRGARASEGGKSIIALASGNRDGTVSRIVPTLAAGVPTTIARSDADYFVTEYGVAYVANKSPDERARALIDIAAPQFRATLGDAWNSLRARR